ncbi:MAG: hypothetical protein K0Q95_352 [Bacteroidota bacterium]|jgi:hypothetical protein|nr:hypothetical protein [Bacteroidota bacterium]
MILTVRIAIKMVTVPIPSSWYLVLCRIIAFLSMAMKFKIVKH